jgi:methyl-accepting chemotaxis protein
MSEPVNVVRSDLVSGSLPTKITGIVFWGTLLVGLLIALIMLYGRESELVSLQATNTILLEHEVKDTLANTAVPLLINKHDNLVKTLQTLQSQLHFEAIELSSHGDNTLLIGEKRAKQDPVTRILQIQPQGKTQPASVSMTVYFPSISDTISTYRKQVLMAIGLMVVIYALILQNIFRVLLSTPFSSMVNTAKSFAEGNAESRFDETYRNEFGFLSKFINKALDSIAAQQKALSEALNRATLSEADLFKEKERAEVTLQSIAEAVITTNASGEV